MADRNSIIEGRNIFFSYSSERIILNNVSFTFHTGEVVSILGPNGSGKTTLLNCIANLAAPSSGEILLNGQNIAHISPRKVARRIGFVPQLIVPSFDFTVLDYVVTGCAPHLGVLSRPKEEHYEIAREAIRKMGIDKLIEKSYSRISGGERQQVSIARALAQHPDFILMDEPTAHLDYGNQIKVLETIRLLKEDGFGVILTTHNPDHALLLRDKVAVLDRNGVLTTGLSTDTLESDFLSALYGTPLKVVFDERFGRKVCAAPQFRQEEAHVTI